MIGERIRAARITSGLSLRALAQQVGVSHQAIFKYEANEDVPGSDVLIALARVLHVGPEFFFRQPPPVAIVPAFRKRSRLSARAERKIVGRIREALERRFELELLAEPRKACDFPPALSATPPVSTDDMEDLAEALRKAWGLGIAPIENLVEVLEDHGVRIEVLDEEDPGFDACGFWARASDGEGSAAQGAASGGLDVGIPVIAVRKGVPGDRQRFSIAHEVGHLLLANLFVAGSGNVGASSTVSCSTGGPGGASESGLDVEKASNRFAGAFIVPRAVGIRELGSSRKTLSLTELYILKHKYGFSIQAWLHRATDLGIISKETEASAFRQMSRLGIRKTEPGQPIPWEHPSKTRQLAFRAVAEGIISRSKAAELLGIPLTEFAVQEV